MCGGIAAAAGAGQAASRGVLFNLGRVAGYAALGAGVGALVGTALGAVPIRPLAIGLRLLAALLMLAMGLSLLTGRDLLRLERLGSRLWQRVGRLAGRSLSLPAPARFATLGLLWGFLPCGLVYSALSLAAASGSTAEGALTMLAFGLGTLPSMLAMTLSGSAVTRRFAGLRTRRAAGVLMVVFAVWTAIGPLAPHPGHTTGEQAGQQRMRH